MVGIGASHGVNTVAFLTSMEQPLGDEVGNANEIKESIDVLRGEGPDDVTELTMVFGETMLELAGIDGGREQLEEAIESGAALQKLIDVTVAHGGDPSVVEDPTLLVRAPHEAVIDAPHDGYVTRCDALTIGVSATRLGAGRERKDDIVDPGVGITLKAKLGDHVAKGDPLAIVRYGDQSKWDAQRDNLSSAWTISDQPMVPPDLIIEKVDVTTICSRVKSADGSYHRRRIRNKEQ